MKLEYDPVAKAVYIRLTDAVPYFGIVDRSQEITNEVVVDWMKDGILYGIEVLCVDDKPVIEELLSEIAGQGKPIPSEGNKGK